MGLKRSFSMKQAPYLSYSQSLMDKYGYRIFRVGVDAGFSCPNRRGPERTGGCVYCDSQGATAAWLRTQESKYNRKSGFVENIDCQVSGYGSPEDIRRQIERGRAFLERRYKASHFALYFQSFSNTFAPVARLKEIYDSALEGYSWDELIISTRPDCTDDEKLDLLASYKERGLNVCLELGLQSGDDAILKAMNRGHSVQCLIDCALKAKTRGLEVCLHVLTGFPGEGREELDKTIAAVNAVHPAGLKIHNLNIAAGTELYEQYLRGEVTAPCAQRHRNTIVYFLRRIYPDIVIERLLCETPSHRLAAPRNFPDKNSFLRELERYMNENNYKQGDLFK